MRVCSSCRSDLGGCNSSDLGKGDGPGVRCSPPQGDNSCLHLSLNLFQRKPFLNYQGSFLESMPLGDPAQKIPIYHSLTPPQCLSATVCGWMSICGV